MMRSLSLSNLMLFLSLLEPCTSFSLPNTNVHPKESSTIPITAESRRAFVTSIVTNSALISTSSLLSPNPVRADDDTGENDRTFTRTLIDKQTKSSYGYTLTLPPPSTSTFTPTNKPLQTHLDELNLPSTSIKGYQYSITVDPIRLQSLRQFGTPEQIGAKIVMAELNRDGILDVTMGRDPAEDETTGAYDVEYVSSGKRGVKHFVTRTVVDGGKLFVLTVQVKEDDWKGGVVRGEDVWDVVDSFRVTK